MILNLAVLLLLLSPIFLITFLIKPTWFNNLIKQNFSRKKISSIFAAVFATSFVTIGVLAEPVPAVESAQPAAVKEVEVEEKVEETKEELPSPLPTPTPSPSPTPTPSPSPRISPSPVAKPTPSPKAAVYSPVPFVASPKKTETADTGYSCNCSKSCPNMSSCNEAYYQLNTCGCSARDGDDDGVPCEDICPGG